MSVVQVHSEAPVDHSAGVAQLAEQLICNQQVAGSSPITSSIENFILYVDGFPSGQREQTVNLPSQTSVVRIHPHPPSFLREWRNWQTRTVQVRVKAISCRFKSCFPHHVGAKFALLRFHFYRNENCARFLAPPFPQKGTPARRLPACKRAGLRLLALPPFCGGGGERRLWRKKRAGSPVSKEGA